MTSFKTTPSCCCCRLTFYSTSREHFVEYNYLIYLLWILKILYSTRFRVKSSHLCKSPQSSKNAGLYTVHIFSLYAIPSFICMLFIFPTIYYGRYKQTLLCMGNIKNIPQKALSLHSVRFRLSFKCKFFDGQGNINFLAKLWLLHKRLVVSAARGVSSIKAYNF